MFDSKKIHAPPVVTTLAVLLVAILEIFTLMIGSSFALVIALGFILMSEIWYLRVQTRSTHAKWLIRAFFVSINIKTSRTIRRIQVETSKVSMQLNARTRTSDDQTPLKNLASLLVAIPKTFERLMFRPMKNWYLQRRRNSQHTRAVIMQAFERSNALGQKAFAA